MNHPVNEELLSEPSMLSWTYVEERITPQKLFEVVGW